MMLQGSAPTIGAMSGTLPWYVARASGLVAWSLLAASVVWGLLMSTKVVRRFARTNWMLDLHRCFGGLALIFTAVHVIAILSDTYIHFGLASVLVPLASHWHPVLVAYGIVSLYLLAAVELTSLLRRHINRKLWRKIHFLSFPLFVLSTLHGVTAGTDSRVPMAMITVALVAAAVAGLTAIRVTQADGKGATAVRQPRAAARTATGGKAAAGRAAERMAAARALAVRAAVSAAPRAAQPAAAGSLAPPHRAPRPTFPAEPGYPPPTYLPFGHPSQRHLPRADFQAYRPCADPAAIGSSYQPDPQPTQDGCQPEDPAPPNGILRWLAL